MAGIDWIKIPNQSLSVAVRSAGFDLAIFKQYREATRMEIRKRANKAAVEMLEEEYHRLSKGRDLSAIMKGVYVISVSNPFTVSYENAASKIVYIGRGNIASRINSHYQNRLFNFMQCLAGTDFDFHICEPKRQGSPNYFKHIEYLLLEEFKEKIGGGSYPLLNKNAGTYLNLARPDKGWNKPLKNTGQRPLWKLEFQRQDFRKFLMAD